MMKNCSLELRLSPVSASLPSVDACHQNSTDNSSAISPQEIIAFYNRRLRACDVTELQARAIIWMASKGTDEHSKMRALQPQFMALRFPFGFSLKRSLQRFLQKRKKRRQAPAPAPCNPSSVANTY